MKSRIWIALPLAATLMVPAVAQQSSQTQAQQPAASQPQAGSQQQPSSDQSGAARQPLQLEDRQGFWGKINPFARKKYVQRQLSPVVDRTNELDELTQANAKSIKDTDSRAQEGIKMASAKASEANNNAVQAGSKAQQAQQTATEANGRLKTVEQVITNFDMYKPVTQVEIRFKPGRTALSDEAKQALDELATQLKDQKGYVVEVRGLTSGRGTAGIENSERMAESVARYLIVSHDVPLYRMRVLGVGNIPAAEATTEGGKKNQQNARVEISLLKNDLEQLSTAQPLQVPAGR
jgi:outer membrane protein OmpA-like peptidoglycan-associated protein